MLLQDNETPITEAVAVTHSLFRRKLLAPSLVSVTIPVSHMLTCSKPSRVSLKTTVHFAKGSLGGSCRVVPNPLLPPNPSGSMIIDSRKRESARGCGAGGQSLSLLDQHRKRARMSGESGSASRSSCSIRGSVSGSTSPSSVSTSMASRASLVVPGSLNTDTLVQINSSGLSVLRSMTSLLPPIRDLLFCDCSECTACLPWLRSLS